jgi:adenylate cyclase
LSDRGATPLEKDTYLTINHCNVAHSVLTGRFIQPCSTWAALAIIAGLGAGGALLTLRLRILSALVVVALLAALYAAIGFDAFSRHRYWLPMVTPVGCLVLTHFALVSYQAFFEQSEKRRIKQVFARIVSPNVVQELLKAEALSLVGARHPVTVMFADVRGFTEMTDLLQMGVEEHVRGHQLSKAQAQAYSEARAQEVLATVNRYLGTIADVVKNREGTLDKYIGDCVMAFWGAPTPNEQHAVACVRAAIEAQRAIHALNDERAAENQQRDQENLLRLARGQEPLPLFPLLELGTGINTGVVTVGLMGSEAHIQNYTVFGREVNLAARLEPISGRGRIVIGEATYQELLRQDPMLAATCMPLGPTRLKGFKDAIQIYEVPWHTGAASGMMEETQAAAA